MRMKDFMYAKYTQDWYKPKIIGTLYREIYFKSWFLVRLIKDIWKYKGQITNDPEIQWLMEYCAKNADLDAAGEMVRELLATEDNLMEVFAAMGY